MAEIKILIPAERIEQSILMIRGHKVMLDRDLAILYGVSTKALNQAVKKRSQEKKSSMCYDISKNNM
jgi:hypothetical protein